MIYFYDPSETLVCMMALGGIVLSVVCGLCIVLIGVWRETCGIVLSCLMLIIGSATLGAFLITLPRHWWVSIPSMFLAIQGIRVWRTNQPTGIKRLRLSTALLMFVFAGMMSAGVGNYYRQRQLESPIVQELNALPCEVHPDFDGIITSVTVSVGASPSQLDRILNHAAGLADLRQLQITHLGLSAQAVESIAQMKQLRALYLQGTNLDDSGLAKLGHLRRIKSLDLMDTLVSGDGVKQLYAMRNLKRVWLSPGRITQADVSALTSQVPNLEVSY